MSYEGFVELLCEAGHIGGHDAHDCAPKACHCGAGWEWRHSVDQTNGYDESDPHTCRAARAIKGSTDIWDEDHYGTRFARRLLEFEPAPGSAWVRIGTKRKPRHGTLAHAIRKAFG